MTGIFPSRVSCCGIVLDVPQPPLTLKHNGYVFLSSYTSLKNQCFPKQRSSLPKILPSFLCFYYKIFLISTVLIAVFPHLWHLVFRLIFQHAVDDVDQTSGDQNQGLRFRFPSCQLLLIISIKAGISWQSFRR